VRRFQLIEIHEQAWFPSGLRDEITDTLRFGLNAFKAYASIVPLLQGVIDATGSRAIVDLCSGGGGPWLDLARKLKGDGRPLEIWLTDKYPNPGARENVGTNLGNRVRFYPEAVDAANVPRELHGFRTMFTSFHHFPPEEARAILQNAVDARQGIGIFETTKRAPAAIGAIFLWIVFLFVSTPWIRPFRWSRLLWTYVVPVIPFVLVFDGLVSCLRTYRPEELREIIERVEGSEYRWEVGERAAGFGWLPISYSIGYPRESLADAEKAERQSAGLSRPRSG